MLYTYVIVPGILTLLFYYSNFKKSNFLTAINDFLLFKKFVFNKKGCVAVNKAIVLSYFFLFATIFISLSIDYAYYIDEISLMSIIVQILFEMLFLLVVLIIRLIYEFLIIPMWYQRKMQNANMQYMNMQYTQQPMNNVSMNTAPMDNTQINSAQNNTVVQPQTPVTGNVNTEYRFCSQCGTRYSIKDDNCPNCGKK